MTGRIDLPWRGRWMALLFGLVALVMLGWTLGRLLMPEGHEELTFLLQEAERRTLVAVPTAPEELERLAPGAGANVWDLAGPSPVLRSSFGAPPRTVQEIPDSVLIGRTILKEDLRAGGSRGWMPLLSSGTGQLIGVVEAWHPSGPLIRVMRWVFIAALLLLWLSGLVGWLALEAPVCLESSRGRWLRIVGSGLLGVAGVLLLAWGVARGQERRERAVVLARLEAAVRLGDALLGSESFALRGCRDGLAKLDGLGSVGFEEGVVACGSGGLRSLGTGFLAGHAGADTVLAASPRLDVSSWIGSPLDRKGKVVVQVPARVAGREGMLFRAFGTVALLDRLRAMGWTGDLECGPPLSDRDPDGIGLPLLGTGGECRLRERLPGNAVPMLGLICGGVLAVLLWCWGLHRTLRRRSEDALRGRRGEAQADEMSKRLEAALQGAGLASWEWNGEGDAGTHDRHWLALLGLPSKGVDLGRTAFWRECCRAEDLVRLDASIANHRQGRSGRICEELPMRCGNGEQRWFRLDGRLLPGAEGRKGRLAGILVDITEARRLMEQLESAAKLDRSKSEALNLYAIVALTDRRGVIRWVNERFCRISGYPSEELVGKTHRVVNSGHHPAGFFKELWTTILAGQTWRGEICNRTKSGELYWVDAQIIPLHDERGEIDGFLSIREEITQRKLRAVEEVQIPDPLEGVGHPVLRHEELDRRMLGDQNLKNKVLAITADRLGGDLESIRSSLDGGAEAAARAIHALKGGCLNIEAREVAMILVWMEARAEEGKLDLCRMVFPRLEQAVDRLRSAIRMHLDAAAKGQGRFLRNG